MLIVGGLGRVGLCTLIGRFFFLGASDDTFLFTRSRVCALGWEIPSALGGNKCIFPVSEGILNLGRGGAGGGLSGEAERGAAIVSTRDPMTS